jgi:phage terminase small subunit
MRGRKPAAAENVVTGVFAGASPELLEPDWCMNFPKGKYGEHRAAIASERWAALVAGMRAKGTLDADNDVMIEMAALAYADWKLAEAHVAEHGPIVPAPRTKVPMHNPYKAVADAALKRCQSLERDLGIPPVERGRATKADVRAKKQTRASDSYLGKAGG